MGPPNKGSRQKKGATQPARSELSAAERGLLTPELLLELGDAALPAPKQSTSDERPTAAAPQLSKSQQRKLRKVEEAKALRAGRAEVAASLAAHALPVEQMSLMRPSATLGQRATLRQRLRRGLQLHRAGLSSTGDDGGDGDDDAGAGELLRMRPTIPSEDPRPPVVQTLVPPQTMTSSAVVTAAPMPSGGLQRKRPRVRMAAPVPHPGPHAVMVAHTTTPTTGSLAGLSFAEALARSRGHSPHITSPETWAEDATSRAKRERAAALEARAAIGAPAHHNDDDDGDGHAAAVEAMALPPTTGRPHPEFFPRPPAMAAARMHLPIAAMEQEIMEAIAGWDVVVLCGATGCGKTTQLPQYLLESGYGHVAITQPRRVAVIATAQRVAAELGTPLGGRLVGYAVRHEHMTAPHATGGSRLHFLTDGILLRELQSDLLLCRYDAVVVDEAHERSLATDIALGLLSRTVPLRRAMGASGPGPLKLIVMSATLRVSDFVANAALFPVPPPVLRVPARQHPVSIHFARVTSSRDDYVDAAVRKVKAIHRGLPPGGILVFVTGAREVRAVCARLRRAFPQPGEVGGLGVVPDGRHAADTGRVPDGVASAFGAEGDEGDGDQEDDLVDDDDDGNDDDDVGDDSAAPDVDAARRSGGAEEADTCVITAASGGEYTVVPAGGDDSVMGDDATWSAAPNAGVNPTGPGPVRVLPLYAMLSPTEQARIFDASSPPGAIARSRLIVIATNVAETSITIPGVRYVVDTGRRKQRVIDGGDVIGGGRAARYTVAWVSRASAEQRAGRAGRTGPGHCYRLYSSAFYNDHLAAFDPPEIVTCPVEGTVLAMKAMGITHVSRFPYPTPPPAESLAAAEAALMLVGACDETSTAGGPSTVTPLGTAMAALPVGPRQARALLTVAGGVTAAGGGGVESLATLVAWAITLAAVASHDSPFSTIGGAGDDDDVGDGGDGGGGDPGRGSRQSLRAHRAAFYAPGAGEDDAAAAALCEYESQSCARRGRGSSAALDTWCHHRGLAVRTLTEMSALRHQLAVALLRLGEGKGSPRGADDPLSGLRGLLAGPCGATIRARLLAGPTTPPTSGQVMTLRRATATSWPDCIARRIPAHAAAAAGVAPSRHGGRPRIAYELPHGEELGYLRSPPGAPGGSATTESAPADWVTFRDLVRGGGKGGRPSRIYLRGVTSIDGASLAAAAPRACILSPPLDDPPPWYDASRDVVNCWRAPTLGPKRWPLPLVAAPHPGGAVRTSTFAAALLSGGVLHDATTAALAPLLAAPPSLLSRKEARGHRRVGELTSALASRGVSTRGTLRAVWAVSPRWLHAELSLWIRAGQQHALDALWGQITRLPSDAGPRQVSKRRVGDDDPTPRHRTKVCRRPDHS